MGILDAITSNPGSFLEGWQEETDKRDAAEAARAKQEAEYALWARKEDYKAGLTTSENLRKEREQDRVRTLERGWKVSDDLSERKMKMFEKNFDFLKSTLKLYEDSPEGIPKLLMEELARTGRVGDVALKGQPFRPAPVTKGVESLPQSKALERFLKGGEAVMRKKY